MSDGSETEDAVFALASSMSLFGTRSAFFVCSS